jgi:molecular chaperone GrpE
MSDPKMNDTDRSNPALDDARGAGAGDAPRDKAAGAQEPTPGAPANDPDTEVPVPAEVPGATEPAAPGAVDFRDRWLRAEADLQNFRRRAQRDLEEVRREAEDRMLRDLLDFLDDLERGIEAARQAGADEAWVSGLDLVAARVLEYLARSGVTVIDPAGEPFDPRVHEALLEVDAPAGTAPGSVVHVIRKGYQRGERPLRVARVGVARAAGE